MRAFFKLLVTLACLALGANATAENSSRIPGHTVHHNAFPASTLSAEIATQYRLLRSKYRGVLNIAVLRDNDTPSGTPVSALIEASASNIQGQIVNIPLQEIREGEAIYYIGQFPIKHEEELRFQLLVRPAGDSTSYPLKLTEQFFID